MTDPGYTETRAFLLKEKQSQMVASMWSSVVKRQFLLGLKGKYAGMCMIWLAVIHKSALVVWLLCMMFLVV